MSREVRRVPLDFDWELNKVWIGFINPYDFSKNCTVCDGTGLNAASRQLWDDWYDSKGYGTRWHYIYKGGAACEIVGDCRRWLDKLTQDEVDELVKEGRYNSLTSDWDKEKREWIPKNPPVIITAEQVNAQNRVGARGMGHDAINMSICFRVRANRLGIYGECKHCDGGTIWKSQSHKHIQHAWKSIDPPTGEGWQVWETVSEGSPISQVFPTAEALIEHLVTVGLNWGVSSGPYSRQAAEDFVKISGWAPSAVIADGKMYNDIESCGYRDAKLHSS